MAVWLAGCLRVCTTSFTSATQTDLYHYIHHSCTGTSCVTRSVFVLVRCPDTCIVFILHFQLSLAAAISDNL